MERLPEPGSQEHVADWLGGPPDTRQRFRWDYQAVWSQSNLSLFGGGILTVI